MKLAALMLIALIAPAQGQQAEQLAFYGEGVSHRPVLQHVSARHTPKAKKAKRKARPKARVVRKATPKPDPTRVLAAEYRPDEAVRCLFPVRVVGSQWATQDGAEESARKSWSEEVRFNFGESFMDMSTAQSYRRRCTRSSIGEIAGQTLHRCEIEAMPCRPGLMEVSK